MFKGQPLALAWFKSAAKPTTSLSEELITGGENTVEGEEDDVLEVGGDEPEVGIAALYVVTVECKKGGTRVLEGKIWSSASLCIGGNILSSACWIHLSHR